MSHQDNSLRPLEYMDINEIMAKFSYIPIGLKYFKPENGILDLEQCCFNLYKGLEQDLEKTQAWPAI